MLHFLESLQFSPVAIFFMVLIVSTCVLGGVFAAVYFLNKAVERSDL